MALTLDQVEAISAAMLEAAQKHDLPAQVQVLQADNDGAKVWKAAGTLASSDACLKPDRQAAPAESGLVEIFAAIDRLVRFLEAAAGGLRTASLPAWPRLAERAAVELRFAGR